MASAIYTGYWILLILAVARVWVKCGIKVGESKNFGGKGYVMKLAKKTSVLNEFPEKLERLKFTRCKREMLYSIYEPSVEVPENQAFAEYICQSQINFES